MSFTAKNIAYRETCSFSALVTDYLEDLPALQGFVNQRPTIEGIKTTITYRLQFKTNRALLVNVLKQQYANDPCSDQLKINIDALLSENTFTICTAHQPNIFTGHLYFIYKILHAIKLADQLKKELPGYDFVPVFYMGSEDADLDELGHIYLGGEKYQWQTGQTGAVGRMKVDKELVKLIGMISGQLTIYPFGEELIQLLIDCYIEGITVEQATFKLINEMFGEYGLIVLLPDNADLKRAFIPVVEKELTEQFSHQLVKETAALFPKTYKVQAGGREINLFYLENDLRERIVNENSKFKIQNTKLTFDDSAIKKELLLHPEKFSPNVILRPVFQEMILPNIAFIGGGGEVAYWLELKKVFEAVNVPFPVLVLRNSFMVVEKSYGLRVRSLGFKVNDMFKTETELLKELVKKESLVQLSLDKEKQTLKEFYSQLKDTAGAVDSSLLRYTDALQAKAINKVEALEKKMLRAEKRKFEAQQRQIQKIRSQLFPQDNLQERIENMLPYYAKWGKNIIQIWYENSLGLEQEFVILEENS